jgi:transcriptional regulator of acetoin/glycerol metabolism
MPADPPTSDVTAEDHGAAPPGLRRAASVALAFQADRPLDAPMQISLASVDSVSFSRGSGPARAERIQSGGETQLRLEVPDRFLSSSHASLQRVLGRWLLEDEGSRNGTFVEGERITRMELADGALFEIGHSFFVFRTAAAHDPPPVPAGENFTGSLQPSYAAQLRALERAAPTSLPVVLRGETGTGKEVLARLVHRLSRRPGRFQPINCAALPPSLLESELFGYRKGAFSGATEDRPGLVRSADKGTLFLDEIGDLPPPAQGVLLRVLQESEVLPVGDTRPVPVDFRLVVATHRPLEEMAAAGHFRHDLLARLAGFTLNVPPLRERREDLGALIAVLLHRHAPGRALRFSAAAARALFLHAWQLNVRELEKTLALGIALAPEGVIDLPHLPEQLRSASEPKPATAAPLGEDELRRREELVSLLREHRGNVTAVAKVLGKARVQVQRWMRRYGIRPAVFR